MKIKLSIFLILITIGCQTSRKKNTLDDWVQLFNGKDIIDWSAKITGYPLNNNYGNTFRVEDGKLLNCTEYFTNYS